LIFPGERHEICILTQIIKIRSNKMQIHANPPSATQLAIGCLVKAVLRRKVKKRFRLERRLPIPEEQEQAWLANTGQQDNQKLNSVEV